ncbi:MAG: ABC transporter permease [Clostridia bacterium]|nr:ABC transporter permease [Clostridia bacterium]
MEYPKIDKELFRPYKNKPTEELPELSRYGYFEDTFRRFLKHRSSRISISIIVMIALFSIITPLFITRSDTLMDPYYAKLPMRLSVFADSLGIFSGRVERRLGDKGLTRLYAIGVGASYGDSEGDGYSPILGIGESDGRVRNVAVDSYLEVGFIYRTVTKDEYERMTEWERSEGKKLLFPLIADNEYNSDKRDANLWYKTDSEGNAVAKAISGYEALPFFLGMTLEDNYLRDEGGEVIYHTPVGTADAQGMRVRVLYYNYYQYKNGMKPDYLFGTDSQGYDLALRVAGGIRISLLIAITVSLINFVIGALVGAVEGYYGGTVDLVLERVTDVLSGVPFIVVATLFQIYLGDRVGAIPSLLFAFVLTGWLSTANRVRAQFFRFKNSEYVLAARTMGVKDRRIIWRHIFPNTLGTLITASALVIPGVIFTESMLSFLGIVNLGREGVTSLGTLLSDASGIWVNYPHLMLIPASVISLLMISFNLIGNGLRDSFDPGMKGGV